MAAPTLICSDDVTVPLDYGQFLLHTDRVEDSDLPVRLLERRVETWASRPSDDLHDWPEAFEAHLVVGSFGLLYESPTVQGRWRRTARRISEWRGS